MHEFVSDHSIHELILSYDLHFEGFLAIIEALAHEKRLLILLSLLAGDKSFRELKEGTGLKKTALANHLTRLLSVQLISKPAYNTYHIQPDGEHYLQILEDAYQQSELRVKREQEKREVREFSSEFSKLFFDLTDV